MSLLRAPASRSAPHPGAKRKKKPAWDSTLTDLSVHKASPDEIMYRKAVTTSKNIALVKEDKLKQKIRKAKAAPSKRMGTSALLKEVLFDSSQIQDALEKSDRAMAVVKDLFGDDPKKYRGLPRVTVAPDHTGLDTSLPDGTEIEGPSTIDLLSDSVMDKLALNEVTAGSESISGTESESDVDSLSYQPVMDVARFQQLLEAAEKEASAAEKKLQAASKKGTLEPPAFRSKTAPEKAKAKTATDHVQHTHKPSLPDTPEQAGEVTPHASPRILAINDTEKIQHHRARTTQDSAQAAEEAEAKPAEEATRKADLKRVLDGMSSMPAHPAKSEPVGVSASVVTNQPLPQAGDTDYMVTLLDMVSKLTAHLKESELRLKAETMVREQLTQDVVHLRAVVDGLTSDIIATQEEYVSLKSEFSKYQQRCEQQFGAIKSELENHGISVPDVRLPTMHGPSTMASGAQNAGTLSHQNPNRLVPGVLNHASDALCSQQVACPVLHTDHGPSAPAGPAPRAYALGPPQQTNSPSVEGGRSRSRVADAHAVQSGMHPEQIRKAYLSQPGVVLGYRSDGASSVWTRVGAGHASMPQSQTSHPDQLPSSVSQHHPACKHQDSVAVPHVQRPVPMIQEHPRPHDSMTVSDITGPPPPRPAHAAGASMTPEDARVAPEQSSGATLTSSGTDGRHRTDAAAAGQAQLLQQLEELGRQQAQAEDKLQELLKMQLPAQQIYSQVQHGAKISPSISPITCTSDAENIQMTGELHSLDGPSVLKPMWEIKISLPTVKSDHHSPESQHSLQ